MQRFAFALRKLREEAGGITYRTLAQRAGYSVTTLSQAAAGEQLPTLPVVLAYAAACGGDPVEWEARWKRTTDEVAALDSGGDAAAAEPPYRGLARFETGDGDLFFGRDRLTTDLLDLLRRRRFAAVFGPSGSGKSSLLRAGLIPALRHAQDTDLRPGAIRILTPGEHPLHTHARAFTPRGTAPNAGAAGIDTFVVVDQFEEIFTLCQDSAERARFIGLLLAARRPESRLRVLIAVRADFYGHCAEHRDLAGALRDAHLLVGPMSRAELREAIVKPATTTGLTVERALTARLVEEVTDAPGGLPLLSHVLLETWRRRRGKTLTMTGYEAAGGLAGAIAKTAEEVYGRFTEDQARAARLLLLRLVTPGDGAPDTRRPAGRTELQDIGGHETAPVLEALTRARLLTADDDTVDLAHEALLTAWPRLRRWIDQDRERLRLHRTLTEAARAWKELGRDPGALYRGTRLATAQEHFGSRTADLTSLEHAFITASITAREEEQRASARTTRRLHRLRAGLSALAVLALLAGVIAWQQNRSEELERLRTEARRMAALAEGMRFKDPKTAMLLSVAAWKSADLPETRSAVLAAAWQREEDAFTVPDGDPFAARSLSLDGRTVISVGRRQVTTWDLATHRRVASYKGLGSYADDYPEVSIESRTAVLTSAERVRLWDLSAGRPIRSLPFRNMAGQMNPSGRTVIVYGTDRSMQLRDITSGRLIARRHAAPHTQGPVTAQVSADDRFLAFCGGTSAHLEMYDLHKRQSLTASRLPVARLNCRDLVFTFSRDNHALLTVTDSKIQVWDVPSGRLLKTVPYAGIARAFLSPDRRFLAATDYHTVFVWRLADPSRPVFRYPLVSETITMLRWAPDGRTIRYLSGLTGSTVRSLDVEPAVTSHWSTRPLSQAAFISDGRILATARSSASTVDFRLRDIPNGQDLADTNVPCPAPGAKQRQIKHCTGSFALTPDGRSYAVLATDSARRATVIVSGPHHTATLTVPSAWGNSEPRRGIALSPDRQVIYLQQPRDERMRTYFQLIPGDRGTEVWNVHRREKARVLTGVTGDILALRPDGKLLATSSGQLVDLPSGRITLRSLGEDTIRSLAFSTDGRHLAVGDDSGRVTVWDSHTRQRLAILAGTSSSTGTAPEPASALSFSPDGHTLAVGGTSGTTQLWDVTSQLRYGSAVPSTGDAVLALAFSRGGKTLRQVGKHTPPQEFAVSPDLEAAHVCRRVGHSLSAPAWHTLLPGVPYRKVC
ncbi:helix-turn-helix domain-containing protein [Streptomyces capoamus]|uniref:nSTAND1 domain-containing NTPase n=1 Tax=Streptomyces capoamus TaxID=68183 RepID=UPI003C2E2E9F